MQLRRDLLCVTAFQKERFSWPAWDAVWGAIATTAQPQSYPLKPIRVVVPFAPGGATGYHSAPGRTKMTERFGQTVVVENRPGASGAIGVDAVAKSTPDGYTVLLASTDVAVLPHLQKTPYDVDKDLVPVSLAVVTPLILVVHPSLSATTVLELVALAKARPGQLSYGSAGSGGVAAPRRRGCLGSR